MNEETSRGRDATRPAEITASGWLDIAARIWNELGADNVSLAAAGVGLFAFLAAFPALAVIVALYGVFASPMDVVGHLELLSGVMPREALEIFRSRLTEIARQQGQGLGLGIAIGLLIALWSARQGMSAVMQACNVAYDENEKRGYIRQVGISLALTAGAIVYFILGLGLVVALPFVIELVIRNDMLASLLNVLRWPLLWLLIVLALAIIYRFAPSRSSPKWRWVTWGSAIAATLWVLGSIGFAFYVRNFGSYGETYGALGGVVVLLLWVYLSGYAVILGAEINAEIEHQTRIDSTTGPEKPMGERNAYVADHLGRSRN